MTTDGIIDEVSRGDSGRILEMSCLRQNWLGTQPANPMASPNRARVHDETEIKALCLANGNDLQ
jgi:hypothetical protein